MLMYFIGNKVKKDFIDNIIVKYEGVHSNLAMTVCNNILKWRIPETSK